MNQLIIIGIIVFIGLCLCAIALPALVPALDQLVAHDSKLTILGIIVFIGLFGVVVFNLIYCCLTKKAKMKSGRGVAR